MDWSKSVAVIVRRSSAASNKKFDRIGIVVFRSTTDCAAVNSRSNSARETVISRFPVGAVVMGFSWVRTAASWATGVIGEGLRVKFKGDAGCNVPPKFGARKQHPQNPP